MTSRAGVAVEGFPGPLAARLGAAVERAAEILRCPALGVEICAMEPGEARMLNRRFRGKNTVADILSFPLPPPFPGGVVGQVLLCSAEAQRHARRSGKVPIRWMEELCVHGFLHLLGFRHDDGGSAALMNVIQRSIVRHGSSGKGRRGA